jgi:hypothetical protein
MALEDVAAEIKAAKSAAAARKLKAPEKKAPEDTAPQKKVSAPPSAEAQRLAKAAEQAKKLTADIKALGEESTKVGEDALAAVLVTAKGIDNIAARQMGLQGKAVPSGEQIGKGGLPDFKPGQTLVPPEVGGPAPTSTTTTTPVTVGPKPIDEKMAERRSAFALLRSEFDRYGLGDLVGDIQSLAEEGISPSEFSLRLRQTQPYQQRFAANQQRINKGLRALSEAEYIGLEDQYQNVMRRYGLPASFYAKGERGVQPELQKFIAGDVSPAELEDRVQLAATRVQNAAPEVMSTLEKFYPGITKSNLLAYTLDPERALPEIQRQIQSAEIGAAGQVAGLSVGQMRAEELARRGITQAQAQQGYQTISEVLPRAEQLASIYGAEPYDQVTAEQEVFGLQGAASARRKRQKLGAMEQAQFQQQTGLTGTALERNRAGRF